MMACNEVYATGSNAWRQMAVPKNRNMHYNTEPPDLHEFTQVFCNELQEINDVTSFLSYTLVNPRSSYPRIYGRPSPEQRALYGGQYRQQYKLIAVAGNGKVSIYDRRDTLRTYDSARKLLDNWDDCAKFPGFRQVTQLVAYDVGFAALDSGGRVFTWGEVTYPKCLGREAPTASLCREPRRVFELEHLATGEVIKIAANGYTLGAQTDQGDVYCWGGHPAQAPFIEGLGTTPNLVDVDGERVEDFAIGDSHMIVLTEDDRVLVVGKNTNGQLGIAAAEAGTWTQVPINLETGRSVGAVRAGPRNSFLIVDNGSDDDGASDDDEGPQFTGGRHPKRKTSD